MNVTQIKKKKKEADGRGATSLDTDLLTASDNRLSTKIFQVEIICLSKRAQTWRRVRYSRSTKLMFVLAALSTGHGHDPRIRMPDIESVIFQSITHQKTSGLLWSEDYSDQQDQISHARLCLLECHLKLFKLKEPNRTGLV